MIDSLTIKGTNRVSSPRVIARNEANSTEDNQGTSMFGEGYRRMYVGNLASGA